MTLAEKAEMTERADRAQAGTEPKTGPRAETRPEKATHQRTRAHNQQLVLRTIYETGTLSRADVARVTRLTRTSVSDLVGDCW